MPPMRDEVEALTRFYRVERLNPRTGLWRQISGEGMGDLAHCQNRFDDELASLKVGHVRIIDDWGQVVRELIRP